VTVGGIEHHVRLATVTVGEALAMMNVPVGPDDRVYPETDAMLSPGASITLERVGNRTWTDLTSVPFAVQKVADPTVLKGQEVVRSAGRGGLRQETFQAEYVNGRRVAMQTIADVLATPPVPRIIAIGTKPLLAASGPHAGREIMYLEATAYYPGPLNYGGGVGSRTAIGLVAQHGVVAVDPSIIKLGTRLYVEGYGDAVAGDTGGAIQGRRIDLCFNTYDEAMRFGRRTVRVYLLNSP